MKIYKVGGCVRDMLLGIEANDVDYVVTDSSQQEMLNDGFIQVGKDFPVFLHPETRDEYALARIEKSTGNSYNDFVFETKDVTLKDDISRRDFTINGICVDIETNKIIDYFNGQLDLHDGVIRHISDSFVEDPVRILRAARFAAKYNFRIANETTILIKDMIKRGMLDSLVPDRVYKELEKVLKLKNPEVFFLVLDDLGALEILFPEIACLKGQTQPKQWHPETIDDLQKNIGFKINRNAGIEDYDAFVHTMLVLQEAVKYTDDIVIKFASLTHDFGKGLTKKELLPKHYGHELAGVPVVEEFCDRLHIPNSLKDVAVMTSREHINIHRFNELNNKTILKLFQRCDVFRKPENFRKMIIASICDANGRGDNKEKTSFDKVDKIMLLVEKVRNTNIDSAINKKLTGEKMRNEVNRLRLNTINQERVNV